MRRRVSSGCSLTSNPSTVAVPLVAGRNPVKMRIVVVFPAPFGPKKPTTSPSAASNEAPDTAECRPKRLVRLSTLIILGIESRFACAIDSLGQST